MLFMASHLQPRYPLPLQHRYNYTSLPSGRSNNTKPGTPSRISQVIKNDHRQLEYYYRRIKDSQDAEEKLRFQNAFVWALARHSIGEELVVYPEIENRISGGDGIAEKDRQQHQIVCEVATSTFGYLI
jgi:hypothetical protein